MAPPRHEPVANDVHGYFPGPFAGNVYFVGSADAWALIDTGLPNLGALPPDTDVPGLPGWTSITTAGHSPGHVAFYREEDGVLITGDALLTVDLGSVGGFVKAIVRPGSARLTDPPRYLNLHHEAVVASAAALLRLRPRVLAPGHGRPLVGAALEATLEGYARTHGSL